MAIKSYKNKSTEDINYGRKTKATLKTLPEYLHKKDREDFWRFVSIILTIAMIVLSVITIFGIILAPVIVRMIAPGFMANPQKLLLAQSLARPYRLRRAGCSPVHRDDSRQHRLRQLRSHDDRDREGGGSHELHGVH